MPAKSKPLSNPTVDTGKLVHVSIKRLEIFKISVKDGSAEEFTEAAILYGKIYELLGTGKSSLSPTLFT